MGCVWEGCVNLGRGEDAADWRVGGRRKMEISGPLFFKHPDKSSLDAVVKRSWYVLGC